MHAPRRLGSAAALLALASACGEAPRPSALVLTLDTTRADALGAYGGRTAPTPRLDALAAEGTAYLEARTVAPLTLPAHASLWTGLYPPRHRVRDNGGRLPEEAVTLAELARRAGYDTAAFVAAVVLDAGTGLAQGFEVYDQPERPELSTSHLYAERPATEVNRAFLAWLDAREDERPFLAWVHYFEPHFPYEPAAADLRAAGGSAYHGEVVAADRAAGQLLDALNERGLLERTIVVVAGDHGEALGEHGEASHSAYCYEGVLRVPLLLRRPGGAEGGHESRERASLVDVAPTLVEALGLEPLPAADGRSLWSAPVPRDRGLYFESLYGYLHYGWSPLLGWLDDEGKYLHSSAPELYDPVADPAEARPLPIDEARRRHFEGALRDVLARAALPEPGTPGDNGDPEGGERAAGLARLGYASGAAEPAPEVDLLAPGDRPAPRERADELGRFTDAQVDAGTGRFDEAARALERIVAENPRHATALFELGQVYVRLGRFAEAVAPLRRAISLGNDWYGPRYQLGVALAEVGRTDEAVVELERALEQNPALELARERLRALR